MHPYSIDLERMENVHQRGDKIEARCPACFESGADRQGNHFFLKPSTGLWGCAANPNSREHRQRIFALIGISTPRPPLSSSERRQKKQAQREEWKRQRDSRQLQASASKHRENILSDYAWSRADMWHASPTIIEGDPEQAWRFIVALFPADSLLWIGEPHQSGPGRGEPHFQKREAWLQWICQPAGRISPSSFLDGPCRAIAAVKQHHFLCVEADTACGFTPTNALEKVQNKEASAALILWLRQFLGWQLRAVIDTGNKSLHAWFDHPGPKATEELATISQAWGIDAGLLKNSAAPLRLPGCIHQKTRQAASLLFLHASP